MKRVIKGASFIILWFTSCILMSEEVGAQSEPVGRTAENSNNFLEEIVVTARKREETLTESPVVISVVTGEQLDRFGITNMDEIARLVPQLVIGENNTQQGGAVVIRGMQGADSNPFADQAVSFNIDGVQVSRATVTRMANFDLGQIEVLKGPQALFFGKNSPGGIIAIRSADPTESFEAEVSVGYGFEAREEVIDGYISGPLSDTLTGRLAFFGNRMDGWSKTTAPESAFTAPDEDRTPEQDEHAFRGTLLYKPSERLEARAKLSYNNLNGPGVAFNNQFFFCPLGSLQLGGEDDCKPGDKVLGGPLRMGPNFHEVDPRIGRDSFLDQRQILFGLEINYELTEHLTLTSVTGYYTLDREDLTNYSHTWVPETMLISLGQQEYQELSQELRLASDFDGPLNFLAGVHLQDADAENSALVYLNGANPLHLQHFSLEQEAEAYSVFAQLLWDITPTIELSVGGRYSYEEKELPKLPLFAGFTAPPPPPLAPVDTPITKEDWNDFSPEVTLRWHPSADFMVYGSFKEGFLSGGFNSGSTNFSQSLAYEQQTIEGGEIGLKVANLLDGRLRANFAAYHYEVEGLQIQTSIDTIQVVRNAGKSRMKGAELDFNLLTTIDGLSLYGAIAYNEGRYVKNTSDCYRGQTQAMGCTAGEPNAQGFFSIQDLAGDQIVRAPDWSGNFGFNYDTVLGTTGLKLGLSGGWRYSDSYFTAPQNIPHGRSPSHTIFDATLRIGANDDNWEIAVIGRNLTDELYWVRGNENVFTGGPSGGPGPGLLADLHASMSRGKEIMLRFTKRFD